MIEALKKLRKLRGRSFDELRVRGAQALAARAEAHGFSRQARPLTDAALFRLIDTSCLHRTAHPAEDLLAHFRTRTAPNFFAGFADPDETLVELRRRWPGAEADVIARARRIATEARFDLLGFRNLYFGEPIDWHLEPIAQKRAPRVHWSRVAYLDREVTGDKKIIWELNRHQYFLTLGRAYWYTRDERYAQTFVAHLQSWIKENPPKQGINWASSLEVSFRAISWLWALYFFRESPHLSAPVFLEALKSLYRHARHLETYLSTYFSPNTHLTGEALGLFYMGTLLPEFKCAARWRATGRKILLAELERHVRPDGVYFEQSSYYHRYTTDFYTHFYLLEGANGGRVEEVLTEKLTALLDHLMFITRPDGATPFYGDDDGGRLLMIDGRAADDFRAPLATGAALFARADYKYVAAEAAEETLWLLGRGGLRKYDDLDARAPHEASRAFASGGYYVMRDGWTPAANYLLIDCGPHGALNCGHAHADALALDLAARGRTLLVDPGTYTYTGSSEMRDLFRSTAAHNTLAVDGESSSVSEGPFSWKQTARARARTWITHRRFDFFEGEQDGYTRLAAPLTQTRSILFLKNDYWIMRDSVATEGGHRCDLNFHFAPDARPRMAVEGEASEASVAAVRERSARLPGLEIFVCTEGGQWRTEESWVSRCYGERAAAPVSIFSKKIERAEQFVTFLVPRRADDENARVIAREAVGGRSFDVFGAGSGRDCVLLAGDGGFVETARLASDFAWGWARFAREDADAPPDEMLLIGGRLFRSDGVEVFKSAERAGYVFTRRNGSELHVETDAGGEFAVAPLGATAVILNGERHPVEKDAALRFINNRVVSGDAATDNARGRDTGAETLIER